MLVTALRVDHYTVVLPVSVVDKKSSVRMAKTRPTGECTEITGSAFDRHRAEIHQLGEGESR